MTGVKDTAEAPWILARILGYLKQDGQKDFLIFHKRKNAS
jgi:hypothetical protein